MARSTSRRKSEHGGAVVETAILSLVMVPIVLYAIFFHDAAIVSIKTLEASRYAAWEMTAMEVSDYANHVHNLDNRVRTRKDPDTHLSLLEEVKARWGDDMNSATSDNADLAKAQYGLYNEKASGLMVVALDIPEDSQFMTIDDDLLFTQATQVTDESLSGATSDTGSSAINNFISNLVSLASGAANTLYNRFGFNTKGYPTSTLNVKLSFTHSAPLYKGGGLIDSNLMPTFKSRQKLLVDAWDLKYGGDVSLGPNNVSTSSPGYSYYSQVKKMMFFGFFSSLAEVLHLNGSDGGGRFQQALNGLGDKMRLPWHPVVRSYAMKHANGIADGCPSGQKNIKGCIYYSNVLSVADAGGAPRTFYTNAFKNTYPMSSSNYTKVYRRQSPDGQSATDAKTGYYLGCGQAQMLDRSECWSN